MQRLEEPLSYKIAEYFLRPVSHIGGQDYAAAWLRIVEWFDGKHEPLLSQDKSNAK